MSGLYLITRARVEYENQFGAQVGGNAGLGSADLTGSRFYLVGLRQTRGIDGPRNVCRAVSRLRCGYARAVRLLRLDAVDLDPGLRGEVAV